MSTDISRRVVLAGIGALLATPALATVLEAEAPAPPPAGTGGWTSQYFQDPLPKLIVRKETFIEEGDFSTDQVLYKWLLRAQDPRTGKNITYGLAGHDKAALHRAVDMSKKRLRLP